MEWLQRSLHTLRNIYLFIHLSIYAYFVMVYCKTFYTFQCIYPLGYILPYTPHIHLSALIYLPYIPLSKSSHKNSCKCQPCQKQNIHGFLGLNEKHQCQVNLTMSGAGVAPCNSKRREREITSVNSFFIFFFLRAWKIFERVSSSSRYV